MYFDTSKTKYLLYTRKSSESDERQIQSIEDQEQLMAKVAKDAGLQIVAHLSEAKSAKEPNRREMFNELLKRISKGQAEGILCWKLDRLARNPDEAGKVIGMLQRGEIKHIRTYEKDYRPDDNSLLSYIEFGMANQYIRDLSKNVKRGLESKVKKGWRPGIAPPGYLNTKTYEKGNNFIVMDRKRFALLKRAWELYLSGLHSVERILWMLNNEWGYRTRRGRKPMARCTLYQIFTNPFYAGMIEYGGFCVEGKHEAMVTLQQFHKAQAMLRRTGNPRYKHYEYAYTGLIHCGECGGPVSATYKLKLIKATSAIKDYTLYYCINARKYKDRCSQRNYVNEETIEAEIKHLLVSITLPEWLMAWAYAHTPAFEKVRLQQASELQEQFTILEQQKEKELANLTQLRIRDLVEDEEYIRERDHMKKELLQLRINLRQTAMQTSEYSDVNKECFDFTCYALQKFQDGNPAIKKSILSKLSLNCTIKDKIFSIEAVKWVEPTQKLRKKACTHFQQFEPKFYPSELSQNHFFELNDLILRGQCDTIGTALGKYIDSNKDNPPVSLTEQLKAYPP